MNEINEEVEEVEEVESEATPGEGEPGPVINVEEEEEAPADSEDTPKGGEEKKETEKSGDDNTNDDLHVEGDPEGVTKRIGKAVKRQYDAERERDYYKGLAEGRKGTTEAPKKEEPETPAVDLKPVEEDFEDMGEYYAALAEYSGRNEARKIAKETKVQADTDKAETVQDTRTEAHKERLKDSIKLHPDFIEKTSNPDLAISDAMFENIQDSDNGTEVAYYLANNPEEAEKIYNLSPNATARAMGRIEAGLKSPDSPEPKDKIVSDAPEPVNLGGGGGIAAKGNGDNLSDEDYINQQNRKEAKG
jgi:hypothetical protein